MKICVIPIAVALAMSVSAQSPNATYLTAKQEAAFYLALPIVQREIKASQDQVSKWTQVFQKSTQDQQTIYNSAKADSTDAALAANEKAIANLEKETADTAIAIATPTQLQRIREIALQRLGVEAFGKADVQTELNLTTSQKKNIETLVASYQQKLDDFSEDLAKQLEAVQEPVQGDQASQKTFQDKVNATIAATKPKALELDAYKKTTQDKVMAALTPAQKNKYQAMLGKPFDLADKPQA